MKNNTIIRFFLMLSIISISCKKEKPNDPNIEDKSLAISLSSAVMSGDTTVDFDGDGIDDFFIYCSYPGGINTNSQIGISNRSTVEFLVEQKGFINEITKSLSKGTTIDASSVSWRADAIFYFFDAGVSPPNKFGINNSGDTYVGFRVNNGSADYRYGWLLVNIQNEHTIQIKEYALDSRVNIGIDAGDK